MRTRADDEQRLGGPAELDRKPAPTEFYESSSRTFVKQAPPWLVRYPLQYAPQPGREINHDRLPPPMQLRGMELAYREQQLSDSAIRDYATRLLFHVMITSVLIGLALTVFAPFLAALALIAGIPCAGLASFFWGLQSALNRELTLRRLFLVFVLPVSVAVAIPLLIAVVFASRLVAAVSFGIVAFCAVRGMTGRVMRFYDGWLRTAPHLTPSERNNPEGLPLVPNQELLMLILAIVAFVPVYSSSLALSLVVAIGLAACVWIRFHHGLKLHQLAEQGNHILAQYLTYGRISSGAPGVWLPEDSARGRVRAVIGVVTPLIVTLAVGLSGYFPWDAPGLKGSFVNLERPRWARGWLPGFAESPPASGTAGQEEQSTGPSPGLNTVPFGWVTAALIAIGSGQLWLVWCFPIALATAFLVPPLVGVAVFGEVLAAAYRRRRQLEERFWSEKRPEWQWYVDRLRSSLHVAEDPVLAGKVYEQDHLFLGVEPFARFPVLLDQDLLAEHCYIVGESGSGKTSLGVMPLLMQLIRGDTAGPPHEEGHATDDREARSGGNGRPEEAAAPEGTTLWECPECEEPFSIRSEDLASRRACPHCQASVHVNPPEEALPPPMIILDLKGDPALFATVRAEAEARLPGSFRWFTPEKGKQSHYFNPFQSFQSETRTVIQLCQLFLEALSLSHGEGYGRSYYSRQSRKALFDALNRDPAPQSFQELYEVLRQMRAEDPSGLEYRDIFELVATVQVMTEYPQVAALRRLTRPEQAIHMPSVIERCQTVYFWLPAAIESITVREIGKLALFAFLTAAIDRQRAGKPVRQSYLVIDEFQRLVGENFKVVLEQARSFGIGAILANQSMADLVTSGGDDLRPTVTTNTRSKMYFAVTDPNEVSVLQETSGEEVAEMGAWSETETQTATGKRRKRSESWSYGVTESQVVKPRLTRNDLMRAADHPLDFILHVSRGSGYTQFGGVPVQVRSSWPLSEEVYKARNNADWPEVPPYEEENVTESQLSPADVDRKRDEEVAAQIGKSLEEILTERERELDPPGA